MAHPPPMIVLFDLDDTLYPRAAGVMNRIHELMDDWIVRHLGLDRETSTALRHRLYLQYGTSMAGLRAEHSIDADDFLRHVHDFDAREYLAPNPRLAAALRRIPLRRVVFTNGTAAHAERVLDALGIASLFERIIDVVDVGYVSKPAPTAYMRALAILGVEASACIMVEDSPRNLAPARDLGMTTVLVSDEPHAVADYHIHDIIEVADVVDAILARPTRTQG